MCVCVCVCVCTCACIKICCVVTRRAITQLQRDQWTPVYRSSQSALLWHHLIQCFTSLPHLRVCFVCAQGGVKGQRICEFSCLIMRVHRMNDGMLRRAICAHMGSLAFWLMCVHACVWMKCTIDSPPFACPICFWRSASWEMAEGRTVRVCIFWH